MKKVPILLSATFVLLISLLFAAGIHALTVNNSTGYQLILRQDPVRTITPQGGAGTPMATQVAIDTTKPFSIKVLFKRLTQGTPNKKCKFSGFATPVEQINVACNGTDVIFNDGQIIPTSVVLQETEIDNENAGPVRNKKKKKKGKKNKKKGKKKKANAATPTAQQSPSSNPTPDAPDNAPGASDTDAIPQNAMPGA